ncbi:MAG: ATP-dependent RecD-like DNA helicase [Anaerovibrio sp.]|uniref:SF1B family DNA helicase RecD2 n=1 Tax=Anaerovibrio sp. TaxID=1872532 RepID=UPI002622A908|nr:ATP-dependent RecD-like DNA helicase [Anaerovibrio sp.]MDD7678834.1 ATP-dependent RecD-like DNA helicase [Anaerovibrio sp.]MDY2604468.1 ATP-dependent RecD-like DNA helicase [Anaerovibrio sp.]
MAKLRCVVERITFQSPETGYTVLKARVKDYTELVAVVGNLLDANVGSVLLVEGSWKVDSRYGRQFMAESWEETMPATVYGIEKYLGSGLIKGVGPKFAQRIVRMFGTETIAVIEDDIDRLRQVEGIGSKRISMIKESWQKQKEVKNIMLFLQSNGVSTAYAAKIYKEYGNAAIDKVKENPFRLADDIWGIGFRTADTIAAKLGFGKDSFVRLRSGILYTLSALADEGHVYAERDQLADKAVELLEADIANVQMTLDNMLQAEELIFEEDAIFLPAFNYAEKGTAHKLIQLAEDVSGFDSLRPESQVDVAALEKMLGIQYDEVQAQAVQEAARSKVMVLTGGPGTGKTTTVQGIIAAYGQMGLRILLAAPTGRAAKRMSEATGLPAKTIHRLLECKPPEGYQRNEENPLEGDVLIVDECSMIDIILMNSLLKALPRNMRLVLVGDIDQLPSVGAGNVLRDIIDSGRFPVIRLTRIFRQAQQSRIITNAHRINKGEFPDISNGRNTDFFFINNEEPEAAVQEIVALVSSKLPRYYGVKPSEVQVLTPMQRGVLGGTNLNQTLQAALNPEGEGLRRGGFIFRLYDKVMQVKNNYDKEVFNGDIGRITAVDLQERTLQVMFDGRVIEYDVSELDELVHAYATTIHKAQGSEYPIVVMPVLMTHFVMLQRNLLYTGITRAKKVLVMIGSKKALAYAVHNVTVSQRNTKLKERLMR